jgi:excisionase family DNA binding protein
MLTPTQAGLRLGLSAQRVVQLVKRGELAATLTPLGRLLREADVDRYAEARRAAQAGEAA